MISVTRRVFVHLAIAAAIVAATGAEAARLTFLHLNDVYVVAPKDGRGGFAPLMTVLQEERAKAGGAAITTFGGDLLSPSILSTITKGAHMIELMNAIGLDAAVPGNHEFDFGSEVLARRIDESRFAWLAANVTPQPGVKAAVFCLHFDKDLGVLAGRGFPSASCSRRSRK